MNGEDWRSNSDFFASRKSGPGTKRQFTAAQRYASKWRAQSRRHGGIPRYRNLTHL
jgi:hypothetical protein